MRVKKIIYFIGGKMLFLIIISLVLMSLSVEWLSLLVLAIWLGYAAIWLIKEAGEHGAI